MAAGFLWGLRWDLGFYPEFPPELLLGGRLKQQSASKDGEQQKWDRQDFLMAWP